MAGCNELTADLSGADTEHRSKCSAQYDLDLFSVSAAEVPMVTCQNHLQVHLDSQSDKEPMLGHQ